MSIRKRELPSGKICWLCDYRDGSGQRRCKQFKTQKQAKTFSEETGCAVRDGTHTPDRASVTIREASEKWLHRCELRGLENGTLKNYRAHLHLHVLPRIGNVRLSRLTRPLIESFKDDLTEKHGQSIARQVLTTLKSLVSEAQKIGLVSSNAARDVQVEKSARHESRAAIPAKDEIRAIIAAVNALPPTAPWRAFVTCSLFTGMRPSELRGLVWERVDFEKRIVEVRQRADFQNKIGSPKSKAGNRDIPLSPLTLNVLRQWRLACRNTDPGDLVFPAERSGGAIAQSTMKMVWDRLLSAAGLAPKSYRLYDLRHAAISMLIEQGLSPKKVQVIAGHSKISMTLDTYGHCWQTPESDQEAMAQIEARLSL